MSYDFHANVANPLHAFVCLFSGTLQLCFQLKLTYCVQGEEQLSSYL